MYCFCDCALIITGFLKESWTCFNVPKGILKSTGEWWREEHCLKLKEIFSKLLYYVKCGSESISSADWSGPSVNGISLNDFSRTLLSCRIGCSLICDCWFDHNIVNDSFSVTKLSPKESWLFLACARVKLCFSKATPVDWAHHISCHFMLELFYNSWFP